jgi:hypothetical protein
VLRWICYDNNNSITTNWDIGGVLTVTEKQQWMDGLFGSFSSALCFSRSRVCDCDLEYCRRYFDSTGTELGVDSNRLVPIFSSFFDSDTRMTVNEFEW